MSFALAILLRMTDLCLEGATGQPPLQPGVAWEIPILCSRVATGRMYPHVDVVYHQGYMMAGEVLLWFSLKEAAHDLS